MPTVSQSLGLSMPIQLGPTGYFGTTLDTLSQAKVNITNLFNTRIGERVMNPSFGTSLYSLIMEPYIDSDMVLSVIQQEVSYWLSGISIISVNVIPYQDDNTVDISIVFSINNTVGTVQVSLNSSS